MKGPPSTNTPARSLPVLPSPPLAGPLFVLRWLLVVFSCAFAMPLHALETVTLQLKWRHQFQFAGYYAAVEKGYYRDAGIEVVLREASPDTNVVDEIRHHRAQFGIAASDLLLERRRANVVALAAIFQHSPLILLGDARRINNLHELAHQKVMFEHHAEELFAYLRRELVPPERLSIQPHTQNPLDIIEGRVAAMSAYSTTEPYFLQRAGVPTIEFSPRAGGIDFYGDVLFTLDTELRAHPERVRAFRAASLRGWEYALKNQGEMIELILAKYNTQNLDRSFLEFEATRTRQLMQAEIVEIGHMNPGRWQHIGDTYASLGMKSSAELPEGFLYEERPERIPYWAYRVAALIAAIALILAWLARRNVLLARKLRVEVAEHQRVNRELAEKYREIQALQDALQEQALRDPLSGLHNRRYLTETLPRELARARREHYPLAVVIIDLDHFKQVNDRHGHPAGDAVICALADILKQGTRSGDVVCRHGGEEFLVVLPAIAPHEAAQRVEDWRIQFAHRRIQHDGVEISATFSAGVAAYPDDSHEMALLIDFADDALYRAKQSGRNRVSRFEPSFARHQAAALPQAED